MSCCWLVCGRGEKFEWMKIGQRYQCCLLFTSFSLHVGDGIDRISRKFGINHMRAFFPLDKDIREMQVDAESLAEDIRIDKRVCVVEKRRKRKVKQSETIFGQVTVDKVRTPLD